VESIELLMEMYPCSEEIKTLLNKAEKIMCVDEIEKLRTNRVDVIIFDVIALELSIIQLTKKEIIEIIDEYMFHDEIPFCVILSKTPVIIEEGLEVIENYYM